MILSSLTMLILTAAFFWSALAYFIRWPGRRIVNVYFLVMGGIATLMIVMITMQVIAVQIVWLSWVLLLAAIGMFVAAMRLFRTAQAIERARERALIERMAGR